MYMFDKCICVYVLFILLNDLYCMVIKLIPTQMEYSVLTKKYDLNSNLTKIKKMLR